jgi:hypothetical protein
MKMTQIMSKILKGILLYFTIIYSLLFLLIVESLLNISLCWVLAALFLLIVLVGGCIEAFKNDSLENYVPKWFR